MNNYIARLEKAGCLDKIIPMPYGKSTNPRWVRIECVWNQRYAIDREIKVRTHRYAALMNIEAGKSYGDIYMDCSKRKIYAKLCCLILGRPIHTIVKTVSHLLMIRFAKEVYVMRKAKSSIKEWDFKHLGKVFLWELADSIRTPLYGSALTLIAVAAVLVVPFSPERVYDVRKHAGKLEFDLYRGSNENSVVPLLAPCFQPKANLFTMHEDWGASFDYVDIQYSKKRKDRLEDALTQMARALLITRRNKYNCFDQLWGRLDLGPNASSYTSPFLHNSGITRKSRPFQKYLAFGARS